MRSDLDLMDGCFALLPDIQRRSRDTSRTQRSQKCARSTPLSNVRLSEEPIYACHRQIALDIDWIAITCHKSISKTSACDRNQLDELKV